MQENRFFTLVWRFNALAIALAIILILLGAVVGLASTAWDMFTFRSDARAVPAPPETVAAQPSHANYFYGSVSRISDDEQFMTLPVLTHDITKMSPYASSGREYALVNYAFAGLSGGMRWLFETNGQLVVSEGVLSEGPEPGSAMKGRLLYVVRADTDGDGTLTETDLKTVVLTSPDYQFIAEIGHPLATYPEPVQMSDGRTALIFNDGASQGIWTFSIADGTVLTRRDLPYPDPTTAP